MPAAVDVLVFAWVQVVLDVPTDAANPYDPAQIAVDASILAPGDTAARTWPCFFDGERWLLRHRPLVEGSHAVEILVSEDGGAPDPVQALTLEVGPSDAPAPIAVDGLGFRAGDEGFVPLGLNLGWSAGGGTADYERWFGRMEASGGNFARIWLTHFTGQDPEWPTLGRMDPDAAATVDAILDAALAHGVTVMPVLWQHSELEAANWSSWKENPYNAANGGPCESSACFFEDPTALELEARLLRYAVARWGAHPAVGMWEVMNEIDGVEGVDAAVAEAWAGDRADDLRALEGGLHPVSWSYTLPAHVDDDQDWSRADFAQVHAYMLSDVAPVRDGVHAALERSGKPVLVGEWGLDWFGVNDLEDTTGLAWHNANWAALAAGAAGGAMTWWWSEHVEPDDLWWRLEGPATVLAGTGLADDLAGAGPVEVAIEGDDLEVIARGSWDGPTLAWVHDVRSTPPEIAPPLRTDAALTLPDRPILEATFLDPVTGETIGRALPGPGGRVGLPPFQGDLAVLLRPSGVGIGESCGCHATRPGAGGLGALLALLGAGLARIRPAGRSGRRGRTRPRAGSGRG